VGVFQPVSRKSFLVHNNERTTKIGTELTKLLQKRWHSFSNHNV